MTRARAVRRLLRHALPPEDDVAYGDAHVPSCRLDVKCPSAATGFPTVVWFHGGGLP